jgi:hypothetical protein
MGDVDPVARHRERQPSRFLLGLEQHWFSTTPWTVDGLRSRIGMLCCGAPARLPRVSPS